MGLSAFWKPWSADETCPQAAVQDDPETTHAWTAYCDVMAAQGGDTCDDAGAKATDAAAPPVATDAGMPSPDGAPSDAAVATSDAATNG